MTQNCSNHHTSLSALSSKGLSPRRMKFWAIYLNLAVNAKVWLSHPCQGWETFLESCADKQTHNYDTRVLKRPSIPLWSKALSHSRMKWWTIYTNLPVNAIVRLPHPRSGDSQGQKTFLALSAGMQSQNFDTRVLKPPLLPVNTKLKGIEL